MSTSESESSPSPRKIIAAFAAIYGIWGSTYLGIRFAIETLPPFLMAGTRFVLAGAILYCWLRFQGVSAPALVHWKNAAVVGTLLVACANGGVTWAEQTVPSGLTALLVAVTPFWMVLFDWLRPRGTCPGWKTWTGLGFGLLGVALLASSKNTGGQQTVHWTGLLALAAATVSSAAGSLCARYAGKPSALLIWVAMQMLWGGSLLLVAGLLLGEGLELSAISAKSMGAFLYLALFGSLISFSAYNWLLLASTPARVSTYAYVNPGIAVCLGWALGGEPLSARILWAGAIIVAAVVLITQQNTTVSSARRPTTQEST